MEDDILALLIVTNLALRAYDAYSIDSERTQELAIINSNTDKVVTKARGFGKISASGRQFHHSICNNRAINVG